MSGDTKRKAKPIPIKKPEIDVSRSDLPTLTKAARDGVAASLSLGRGIVLPLLISHGFESGERWALASNEGGRPSWTAAPERRK